MPAADHEDVLREQEERDSIAASFAPIVEVVRRYKATGGGDMTDEITVPDTVYVGSRSDTYLSGVRVKGLKDMDAQNIDVSWKEGLVSYLHRFSSADRNPAGFEEKNSFSTNPPSTLFNRVMLVARFY